MNIEDLILKQIREVVALFGAASQKPAEAPAPALDNGMTGKYVIVRCRDAGVHTGFLESYNGREAVLKESRRLWYWKPANNQKYLSGVAVAGLHADSKVGAALERIHLTETCEIIQVNQDAIASIAGAKVDERE